MKTVSAVVAVVMISTGCASYRPVIDTQGVDSVKMESDLAACQKYAEQVSPGAHAAVGAGAGAVLGAVVGALVGGRRGANMGAGVYGATGAAAGGAEGAAAQTTVVKNCMAMRGYKVLY